MLVMWLRKRQPKQRERELWTRLGGLWAHPEREELMHEVLSCRPNPWGLWSVSSGAVLALRRNTFLSLAPGTDGH